ncbi:MAG TPA: fluoride efflux transporter CrcB [Clostridia bacterium]|nr:fluoride efflux transporter CrcB [Clostridia bacterium]
MQKILYVGIGGFIGAATRYLISIHSAKLFGTQFPVGTLVVNVLGGLLIGLIMELSLATDLIPPNARIFLTTGVLGGLTTFSTFSYETVSLFSEGSYLLGGANLILNLFLSLCGVVLGKTIVRIMI